MRSRFSGGVVVGIVLGVVVLMAGSALAGSGIGGIFNLGKKNTVDATSSLQGGTNGKMLQVTNTGTGPALGLTVGPGKAPFTVSSGTKVKNLNADRLDGLDSGAFLPAGTVRRFHLVMSEGQAETGLLSIGPLSFAARCFQQVSGQNTNHIAEVRVATSEDHSVVVGGIGTVFDMSPGVFHDYDLLTSENAVGTQGVQLNSTDPNLTLGEMRAIAPSGWHVMLWLDVGNFVLGDDCTFSGYATVVSSP